MRESAALLGAIVAALALSSCATQKIVLAPTPSVEARKEPSLPSARVDAVKATPVPVPTPSKPAPDYSRMYSEAISRTKEAFQRGSVKEAIPLWKALEESPWHGEAVFHQGIILHLAGDLEGAAAAYRRVGDLPPVYEPAAANLLGIYLLRGNLREARILVDRLLPPGSEPAPGMLPELQSNIGAALVEFRDPDRAARIFLAMQAKGIAPPSVSWNMAVLAYRNGDVVTARRMASMVPSEVGSLWPVIASRFAWERESGKVPPPGDVPAAERRISALAWNLAAFDEYRKGNLQGAEGILARNKENNAHVSEIVSNLGLMQLEQGKWKEARENLEKAVGDDPGLPEGWLNLGVYREVYEGNPSEALKCFNRYVMLNGSRKDEVRQWIEWLQKPSPR
ncbi:MAG: tetratricopeptide repeat protein [Deltaproteobacteria bacterium]|nr:tetratricopeptide repeat protein [Deltaproteobacteria bacterium]